MKRILGVLLLVLVACGGRPNVCTDDRQKMAQMVDRTVHVECDKGWGSGVILGPAFHAQGFTVVATAAHVMDGCTGASVRGFPVAEVVRDKGADVSLLLVEGLPRPLLDQSRWYLGMPIVTVGWPKQLFHGRAALQVSRGHLTADMGKRLKVSSPAYFGNSGGPVFDEDGKLVGLLVEMNVILGAPVDGHYYVTPARRVLEMYGALR